MILGVLREQRPLLAALPHRQEEREEKRADEKPRGDFLARGKRLHSGHRTEHEAERDDHHVDDHHVLEAERVGDVEHVVGRRADQEPGAERPAHGNAARQQDHEESAGGRGRDAPGRNRAEPLLRMDPILIDVDEIVQHVDRRGEQAECEEPLKRGQELGQLSESMAEHHPREEHGVLRPLADAHLLDQVAKRHAFLISATLRANPSRHSGSETPNSVRSSWVSRME